MLGSQALETAIGLALMFFLLATAASAITEIYAGLTNKRSKDLKIALRGMLDAGRMSEKTSKERAGIDTQIEKILQRTAGDVNASYLSAKSFADASCELIGQLKEDDPLRVKMNATAREVRGQIVGLKAGLERWFDESMAVAQQKYSKWASWFLLGTGVGLAIVLNASTLNAGHDLWRDTAARQAVIEAASTAGDAAAKCSGDGSALQQAGCSVDNISAFQLPLGWGSHQRDGWFAWDGSMFSWWLSHLLGWALTAVLIMLGAPFWFDLLGRLVNVRATGPRAKPATEDPGSHSQLALQPRLPAVDLVRVPTHQTVLNRVADRQGLNAEDVSLGQATLEDFAPVSTAAPGEVDWLATALNLDKPLESPSMP